MIKKLENKDYKISTQIRSVFQESYAIEAELLNATDFPPLKRSLENYITCDNEFFGFLKNHELAGVVEIEHKISSTHIQSLGVNPNFFRQGIAGKLVEFVVNSFSSKIITVETGVKNKPATELYKKYNFKEVKQWNTDHGVRKIRFERNTN